MKFVPGMDPVQYRAMKVELDALRARIADLEDSITVSVTAAPPAAPAALSPHTTYTLASDDTLTQADMCKMHVVNCTSAAALTLPVAIEGRWVDIVNYGTEVVTIKNTAGTAIGTVSQYEFARVHALSDSGGDASWPTVVVVYGASGEIYAGDVVVEDTTKGFVWTDSAGHLWRGTINTSGALVTADLGTSKPPPEEPI